MDVARLITDWAIPEPCLAVEIAEEEVGCVPSLIKETELVTEDDIVELDLDSNLVGKTGVGIYKERFIHGEIYRARPDVMSVVHTHSAGVIPFTVSQVPLRAIYHNPAFLAAGAPVWDIRKDFGETDMLVRTPAIGKSLAQALGDKSVVLYRSSDGAQFSVGPTIYDIAAQTPLETELTFLPSGRLLALVRTDVTPHLDGADLSLVLQNRGEDADGLALITQVLPAEVTDANLANPDARSLVPAGAPPSRLFGRFAENFGTHHSGG